MRKDTLNPMDSTIQDIERLDWLEEQNNKCRYTGKCVFRMSKTGRGWRLHETSGPDDYNSGPYISVRKAIDEAMKNG